MSLLPDWLPVDRWAGDRWAGKRWAGKRWAGDRTLARRLARQARAAATAQSRAEFAHGKAVRRRDHSARRARRALPILLVITILAGLASLTRQGWTGGLVALTAAGAALGAGWAVHTLRRPPVPAPAHHARVPALAPPPHPRSVAWPAVRRLEAVRTELHRLVPLVAPAGREVAQEAWQAAAEADGALRWQAARLSAVEPYRGVSDALLRPLYDGVGAQERLVSAVADLVAASVDPLATRRLQDATDALSGLAQGLREVR